MMGFYCSSSHYTQTYLKSLCYITKEQKVTIFHVFFFIFNQLSPHIYVSQVERSLWGNIYCRSNVELNKVTLRLTGDKPQNWDLGSILAKQRKGKKQKHWPHDMKLKYKPYKQHNVFHFVLLLAGQMAGAVYRIHSQLILLPAHDELAALSLSFRLSHT